MSVLLLFAGHFLLWQPWQ